MPTTIAVAGKGGTGKTTFTALVIRYLTEKKQKAILAIDADPNSNLNEALGLKLEHFISDFIAETKNLGPLPAGMSKQQFIEYRLASAIAESDFVDLIAMGQPEGPGCYCYPNDLVKANMGALSKNYDYLVLDNEAGLEHLSRRVAQDVDYLFVLSDASARGIRSAGRVKEVIDELKTQVDHVYLVVSKVRDGDMARLAGEIEKTGLDVIGTVPEDENVEQFDLDGKPLFELPAGSAAVKAVYEIMGKVPGLR